MFIYQDIKSGLAQTYKESTLKQWDSSMSSLCKQLKLDKSRFISQLCECKDDVLQLIRNLEKYNSRIGKLNPVIQILKVAQSLGYEVCDDALSDYQHTFEEEKRQQYGTPYEAPSQKQTTQYQSYTQFQEQYAQYLAEYNPENPKELKKALIGGFFYYLPPTRGQNVYTLKLLWDEDGEDRSVNHINMATSKIVMVDHKTVKQYGVLRESIPESLYDLIENWMELMGLQEGDWLLPNPRDRSTHMSQASFSQFMAKEFGTGVQMLRNTFVSEYLDQRQKDVAEGRMSNEEFQAERTDIAKKMGHHVSTQEFTYGKFRGKEAEEEADDQEGIETFSVHTAGNREDESVQTEPLDTVALNCGQNATLDIPQDLLNKDGVMEAICQLKKAINQ